MEFGSYFNFLIRILDAKFNIDWDVELFKNNTIKFLIISPSEDELAESIMFLEAIQIIEDAKNLKGHLLENYEEYEYEPEEEDEWEYDNEYEYEYEDEDELKDFENIAEMEDFSSEETWNIKPEKEIYFILQFENEEGIDEFMEKEFS